MDWPVNGPLGRLRGRSHRSSFFLKVDPQLQHMVERQYERDVLKHRFMQKAQKTQFKESRYEIPLPFKNHVPSIPNNKSNAWRESLKGTPSCVTITKPSWKNCWRKATHVRYLPISWIPWRAEHGVYHPYKAGKTRVVFDCSAKFREISLNSMLY